MIAYIQKIIVAAAARCSASNAALNFCSVAFASQVRHSSHIAGGIPNASPASLADLPRPQKQPPEHTTEAPFLQQGTLQAIEAHR